MNKTVIRVLCVLMSTAGVIVALLGLLLGKDFSMWWLTSVGTLICSGSAVMGREDKGTCVFSVAMAGVCIAMLLFICFYGIEHNVNW